MKSPLIIGNWKLNGNTHTIINELITLTQEPNNTYAHVNIAIAPPITYLNTVYNYLLNKHIKLCAQNVDIHLSGAFTGEISAAMLKDLGVQYALIGHSERRMYHKENDLYIAKKFSILKKVDLIPVLCIGENQQEHNSGSTKSVCIQQINTIIESVGIKAFKNAIIAYEPTWAIGSGLCASPEYVQSIHKFIRDYIKQYDQSIANEIFIQYGGSVNLDNIVKFISQKDVDGVLIGSASLNANNLIRIIQKVTQYIQKYQQMKN